MRYSLIQTIVFTATAILLFVWPVAHTVTLRESIIICSLLLLGYALFKGDFKVALAPKLKLPALLYLLLTLWILFGAFFIAENTWEVLDEIRGQWLMSMAALALGVLIASSSDEDGGLVNTNRILLILFAASFLHVIYTDLFSVYELFTHGSLPRRVAGLSKGVDTNNYTAIFCLSILYVEMILRSSSRQRELPFGNGALVVAAALTFFAIYLTAMRNGMAVTVILSILTPAFYFYKKKVFLRKGVAAALITVVVVGAFAYTSVKNDPRWKTLRETVPIALDTETHKAWLGHKKYPFPKLPDGRRVDGSNYERIAWIKEGLKLAAENPLGIGFSRYAYGTGISAKYNDGSPTAHSHSGLLDLAIATGIPGVVLWSAMLISLLYFALKNLSARRGYFSMLLFFVIAAFGLRMLVDSIIRDNMLQTFLFQVSLLSILITKERDANP